MKDKKNVELVKQDTQLEAPPPNKLSDEDMLIIERANNKRQLTVKDAQNATLLAEQAELVYKNIVMQLFLKYGLSSNATIDADGTIKYNGDAETPLEMKK